MIAESPAQPSRSNLPQPPLQSDDGRDIRDPRRPLQTDGDYPSDDMEMTGRPQDRSLRIKAEAAPSRQELPVFDAGHEEAHWESSHSDQPYAGDDDYDRFATAYRIGYEGYERLGAEYRFDDVEEDLQEEYEGEGSSLPWERAREATRAAWDRREEHWRDAGKEAGVSIP